MSKINGTSRNAFGSARGIGENRLRALEGRDILPTWSPDSEDRYAEVFEAWSALRRCRWTNQRVAKLFALIRSSNFREGSREAWERRWTRDLAGLARGWEHTSEEFRRSWVKEFGAPPSEMKGSEVPSPLDEGT
jgi:SpoVK/Ycf46/Vps4 family AAA+-type ATPase